MDLNNIAAIVTGGASGLGEATARALAAKGAKVTIFDLNEELGIPLAKEIGGRFAKVNVTSESDVSDAVEAAQAAHSVARVLVNCAGIAVGIKTVGRNNAIHPLDTFRKVVEVNLIGTFNVISQVAGRLCAADPIGEERGVIISTASCAATEGQVGQAAYSASKGGVAAMNLPIARDLAQHGIRSMVISPGMFLTPMSKGLSQEQRDALGAQVPFPSRLGHPEEYAKLVESIVENPMLNGEMIRLDGAIRMAPR